jgi:hypothetical protein
MRNATEMADQRKRQTCVSGLLPNWQKVHGQPVESLVCMGSI